MPQNGRVPMCLGSHHHLAHVLVDLLAPWIIWDPVKMGAFFNTKNHIADNHIRAGLQRAAACAEEEACLNITIHAQLGITTAQ